MQRRQWIITYVYRLLSAPPVGVRLVADIYTAVDALTDVKPNSYEMHGCSSPLPWCLLNGCGPVRGDFAGHRKSVGSAVQTVDVARVPLPMTGTLRTDEPYRATKTAAISNGSQG
jgi:hypothetical protein